jgi:uncharacterized membrane protein
MHAAVLPAAHSIHATYGAYHEPDVAVVAALAMPPLPASINAISSAGGKFAFHDDLLL